MSDPQSWNRYVYAGNNPLKYVDPLGLYASPAFACSDTEKNCLNDEQRRILNNSTIEIEGKKYSGQALYGKLSEKQQNAFVNITDKLGSIQTENGTALSQVLSITGFTGQLRCPSTWELPEVYRPVAWATELVG